MERGTEIPRSCGLFDAFGRRITYLRLLVTDRCDLRCGYCMAETMTFAPRRHLLSLNELARMAELFIAGGIAKLRITGGEPLVRSGIMELFPALAKHLPVGVDTVLH